VIDHLKSDSIPNVWHLLVPPLLTVFDEGTVSTQTYACQILNSLLSKIDHQTLIRTGLGEMFEEKLLGYLNHFQPITPLNQSIVTFENATDTLITLSNVLYTNLTERTELLDKCIEQGIFNGMKFASEDAMFEVMIRESRKIVKELGFYAARHVERLLLICEKQLSSPFAMDYQASVIEACEMIKELFTHCWFMMIDPQGRTNKGNQIMRGISRCWYSACHEPERNELRVVKASLQETLFLIYKTSRTRAVSTQWMELMKCKMVIKDPSYYELWNVDGLNCLVDFEQV